MRAVVSHYCDCNTVNISRYRPQKYEGSWYQGRASGRGVLWYPDGSRVQGHFDAGHPHGVCTVVWASGRPINAFFERGVLREFIDVHEESEMWRRRAEKMRANLRPVRNEVFADQVGTCGTVYCRTVRVWCGWCMLSVCAVEEGCRCRCTCGAVGACVALAVQLAWWSALAGRGGKSGCLRGEPTPSGFEIAPAFSSFSK
jgi:hypothetical protein